jgi:hypothetical protein
MDNLLTNKYFCIAIIIALLIIVYLYSQKKSCEVEGMQNVDLTPLAQELTETPWTNRTDGDRHKNYNNRFDNFSDTFTKAKLKKNGYAYTDFLDRSDVNFRNFAGREGYEASDNDEEISNYLNNKQFATGSKLSGFNVTPEKERDLLYQYLSERQSADTGTKLSGFDITPEQERDLLYKYLTGKKPADIGTRLSRIRDTPINERELLVNYLNKKRSVNLDDPPMPLDDRPDLSQCQPCRCPQDRLMAMDDSDEESDMLYKPKHKKRRMRNN